MFVIDYAFVSSIPIFFRGTKRLRIGSSKDAYHWMKEDKKKREENKKKLDHKIRVDEYHSSDDNNQDFEVCSMMHFAQVFEQICIVQPLLTSLSTDKQYVRVLSNFNPMVHPVRLPEHCRESDRGCLSSDPETVVHLLQTLMGHSRNYSMG